MPASPRRLASWLGPWANSIAEHHEKFDGTGYPHGLSGTQISVGGRIVAVADSYDAMTAIRSYNKPKSPTAARAELARCAGTHFDPQVVRAFLQVSVGKMRALSGVLSWLGSLPFAINVPGIAQVASVAAAMSLAGGGIALGAIHANAQTTTPRFSSTEAVSGGLTSSTSSGGAPNSGGRSSRIFAFEPIWVIGFKIGHKQLTFDRGNLAKMVPVVPVVPALPVPTRVPRSRRRTPTTTESGSTGKTDARPPQNRARRPPQNQARRPPPPPQPPQPRTTPPPVTATLVIQNGGGNVGRPDLGDEIIVTYLGGPKSSNLCSAWSSTSYPDLVNSNVVVNADQPSSGDDSITSVTDSVDCAGGFHFGSIDLGQRGYINNTETFGGLITSGPAQCNGSVTTGCTRIHWDGKNTLTITLGEAATGCPTNKNPAVAVYTPDPALGVSGTIASNSAVEF